MPCGCAKNKQKFQVQVNGKIVYVTSNRSTAESVSRRYANGTVVEVGGS